MQKDTVDRKEGFIQEMREVGAHYGYAKARRHPSTSKYVFSAKGNVEIFDLNKSVLSFEKALDFVRGLGEKNKVILFVGTKNEARRIIKEAAVAIEAPYVTRRWIGGTLTNWSEIGRRLSTLIEMRGKRESGEYSEKYTKKEQLMLTREIESLENNFEGLVGMERVPDAMFIVDPRHEEIALKEAKDSDIPVIALASTDCNITDVDYPIPANDTTVKSINYFVSKIVKAFEEGKRSSKTN